MVDRYVEGHFSPYVHATIGGEIFSSNQLLGKLSKFNCYIAGVFPATARPFIG